MPDVKMNRSKPCGADPLGWYVVRCSDSTCKHTISDSKERAVRRWNNRNPEVTEDG